MSNEVLTKIGNKAEWATGGGSTGSLIITFTGTSDKDMVCDTTFETVWNALNKGESVTCKWVNGIHTFIIRDAIYSSSDMGNGTIIDMIGFVYMWGMESNLSAYYIYQTRIPSTGTVGYFSVGTSTYYPG